MRYYSFLLESIITPFYKAGEINLYHLSMVNHDGDTFKPRVPDSAGTFYFNKDTGKITNMKDKNVNVIKENIKTPRVVFGRSIQGCMNAVPYSRSRMIWYVHKPVNIDLKYLKAASVKDVPDRDTSNEMWYLKPVKLKCIGMIFVSKNDFSNVRTPNGMGVRHPKYQYITNLHYDPPYCVEELLKYYGKEKTLNIIGKDWKDPKKEKKTSTIGQQAHSWRCVTGLELIHPEPSLDEQIRVYKNWNKMLPEMKKISDKKCKELYGCSNEENYKKIMSEKWGKNV